MAKGSNYKVPFRRRRKGLTNYQRRQKLLRSNKPRIVVRRSNKHERVFLSVAKYEGDEIYAFASSNHLKDYGWKAATGNLPASYLTGYLAGKYAQALGIEEAILDIGINSCRKGTRVSAMLQGAVESGLDIPHDPDVFPDEERYTGQHIADYAKYLKDKDKDQYKKQFGKYLERSAKPESIPSYFKKTLKAIDDEFESGDMKKKLENRRKNNRKSSSSKKSSKSKK